VGTIVETAGVVAVDEPGDPIKTGGSITGFDCCDYCESIVDILVF
jgi:D-arabinose 1-dehydrogenase-like Zn-dependent alcohol dehydrogenase